MKEKKAEFLTDEHLNFLDALRKSGKINMFGAAHYIAEMFDVPMQQARQILSYWMRTFGARNRERENTGE